MKRAGLKTTFAFHGRAFVSAALVPLLGLLVACGSDSKGGSTGTGGAAGSPAGVGGTLGGGGGTTGIPGTGGGGPGAGGSTSPVDAPVGNGGDALPPLDSLIIGDSGPMVITCPLDVATASCTPQTFCSRKNDAGAEEACGCLFTGKWLCPGVSIGADGGVILPDGGRDTAGIAMCPAGTATGNACTAPATVCTGVGNLGCACTEVAGALRWLCY
jgi:hypothetical protein